MDILRRNTDYALRLMVHLAQQDSAGAVSTRVLAEQEDVPYPLACKLMQQLHASRLVGSSMGPRGGFRLHREPGEISLLEVIETIQGPMRLNRCLMSQEACPRSGTCPVRGKIGELQGQMRQYLAGVTLADLVQNEPASGKGVKRPSRRRRR